jgi:hypothetical protein
MISEETSLSDGARIPLSVVGDGEYIIYTGRTSRSGMVFCSHGPRILTRMRYWRVKSRLGCTRILERGAGRG